MANLATPTVAVNDDTIEILPNSLSFKTGRGDYALRTQQSGDGVTVIANRNAESRLSMVKFTLIMTDANHEKVESWLNDRENNGSTIDVFDGNVQVAFQQMYIVSEPERQTGSDGTIEVEFQGPPAS